MGIARTGDPGDHAAAVLGFRPRPTRCGLDPE